MSDTAADLPSTAPTRAGRTIVTIEHQPDPRHWPSFWDLYEATFEPLEELALLNHLYARSEFEQLLDDERITKLIAWRHHRPVGMAMVTNHLDVVPQISPKFLRARYPDHAARDAVFFGIMVFVDDSLRRSSVFARLVAGMGEITARADGIIVFDICRHNLDHIELDRQLQQVSRWFPGSSFAEIDRQSYFAVHLPSALRPASATSEQPGRQPNAPTRLVAPVAGH